MKKTPLLSLAAVFLLAQCDKSRPVSESPLPPLREVTDKVEVPSAPLITENASPHFMKVASQLELGGSAFSYADEEGFMEGIAAILDEVVKNMPPEKRNELPASFSFVTLLKAFGLDSVKAMGSSSRRTGSGLYHSRSYAYMPTGRKGLTTLNGGDAEPLLTHGIAPKGTDLALEFPLYLKSLTNDTLPSVLAMLPEDARTQAEAKLAQPIPPLGITYRQLGEKLDARLGLFIHLDPEQQLPLPGSEVPYPGVDALIVADRIGWLLEPLKTQFMPMLQSPSVPAEVVEKDGILTITFRAPVGPAPMDFQPVLRFDSKADRLMIATRPAFLTAALEGKELLATDAEFKKAWAGLPAEGNSAVYISPVFLQTFRSMLSQGIAMSDEPQDSKDMLAKGLDFLTPYLSKGQAVCSTNLSEGTLSLGNLAFPVGNSSALTTLTTISMLSSFAVPAIGNINGNASSTLSGNEGREIGLALETYAADTNGQYPPTLEELKEEGLIEEDTDITLWLYNATLNSLSPQESIILAGSEPVTGGEERWVIRLNGISELIPESQFEAERDENLR